MENINIEINTEFIKLGQLLKLANVVETGGEGKHLIQDGKVLLNDNICEERGKKVYKNDIVKVNDHIIKVFSKE